MFIVVLCAGLWLPQCAERIRYDYYEVIHRPDRLKAGDTVRIVLKSGDEIRGTLAEIESERLTVATQAGEKRRIEWPQVHILERVQKVETRSYF